MPDPDLITYTRWLTVFTGVLAVATIILAVFTIGLWWSGKDTATRQLRAYLGVFGGEMKIVNLIEGGLGLVVHVEFRNFGQTPAYDLTTWSAPPVVDASNAVPFTDPEPPENAEGRSIAFRDAGVNITRTIAISQADIDAVRAGTQRVFFWGAVSYEDAFGKRRSFSFKMVNGERVFGQPWEGWALAPHRLGYEAN